MKTKAMAVAQGAVAASATQHPEDLIPGMCGCGGKRRQLAIELNAHVDVYRLREIHHPFREWQFEMLQIFQEWNGVQKKKQMTTKATAETLIQTRIGCRQLTLLQWKNASR
jgi:hypothetical protein